MSALLQKLRKDRKGATAIEYGLIAAFISVAIIGVGSTINTNLSNVWTKISTALSTTP
jgi:pilus assembly protein Flp/PilA